MAGQYERVNAHDEDEATSPSTRRSSRLIPNSPPPSFHSRASSLERRNRVDPALADAFEADGDDSDSDDDDADDRQRLMRTGASQTPESPTTPTSEEQGTEQPPSTRNGYKRVEQPPSAAPHRVFGGGTQSDGVFSNMSARPERQDAEKEEQPPTYEQAAADQAPPYWETTILAPGLGGPDDVFIEGLPVGTFFSFLWNAFISWLFQIPGFLFTYLLHSTHAAKNGSRAGLGITLIQFGFSMKTGSPSADPPQMDGPDGYAAPPDPNSHDFDPNEVSQGGGSAMSDISGAEWLSYVFMVVGWFILIRSVSDYLHARRHEQLVLQSPDRGLGVPVIAEGEPTERVV